MVETILHAAAVLLAAWGLAAPPVPPADRQAAVPDFALSDGRQSDAALATYGGVVAWWGTAGDTRLTVWAPGGTPRRLPVVANADPYRRALDVGRGPDGAVWITYARCVERRCRPRGYDLRTGADRDLGVGDGVAASVWGRRVAVVRQTGATARSSLLVGTIGTGVARRVPLPAPTGAPTALDLRDDRVALLAWEPGDDVRGTYLLAGRVSDPATIASVAGGAAGEECTRLVASPTWTATALTWMVSTLGPSSSCGRHRRDLFRRDDRDGTTTVAPIPRAAPKQAVVAAGRVVGLFVARPDGDQGDRDACDPDGLEQGEHWPGCALRVTPAPRWEPAPADG